MKAVIFFGPKQIRLVDLPTPKPGPGQVVLKVEAALTCGTDFKAYRQGHRVLLGDPPAPFGHEMAGIVAEVGEGVTAFKPGMRVVAANSAPCDRCYFCNHGQPQLCDQLKLHNGAYAEYNLVPAQIVKHNLYVIDQSIDFKTAALAEPLACAVHAVDVMRVEAGEKVAIIGAGTMSVLLIHALKAQGAHVIVIGRNAARLDRAVAAGADETLSADEGRAVPALRDLTGGIGADCVFEAVGRPETWNQAVAMARKGGRVCLFGGCASGTQMPVDAHRLHYEQLCLQGVFHHTPKYFREALRLLTQGKIKTDILIQEEIALDEVPAYFEQMHLTSNTKAAVFPDRKPVCSDPAGKAMAENTTAAASA